MKRTIAVLMIAFAASCAYAQVKLGDFKSTFTDFATDMAGAIAVDSTLGANWSDAYVGKFPHMGAGITVGTTLVGADTTKSLFDSIKGSTPSTYSSMGIPIPTVVGTFKIGLPFLPMDIGIKGGFIPTSVGKAISSSGSDFDQQTIGVQLRYALVKQGPGLRPNVSVGAAYNHVQGNFKTKAGIGSQTFEFEGTPYSISASDPTIDLTWKSNTVDLTAQVSKKVLFFVPYLGGGLTLGKSTVDGGVSSDITTTAFGGDLNALKNALKALGYSLPDEFNNSGFTYTAGESSPLFRIYGGFSVRIIILDVDIQGIYLPKTKSYGGSITGRIQF